MNVPITSGGGGDCGGNFACDYLLIAGSGGGAGRSGQVIIRYDSRPDEMQPLLELAKECDDA